MPDYAGKKQRQRERLAAVHDTNTKQAQARQTAHLKNFANQPILTWPEVEDEVEWIGDVLAEIGQFQVTRTGGFATINFPKAYAPELLNAQLGGRAFIRIYAVPVPDDDEDEDPPADPPADTGIITLGG